MDLALQPDYGSSYRLTGRLRNHSSGYALRRVELQITLRDCDPAGACEIVGQAMPAIAVIMPSGQSRDLNESVYFSNLGMPKGSLHDSIN